MNLWALWIIKLVFQTGTCITATGAHQGRAFTTLRTLSLNSDELLVAKKLKHGCMTVAEKIETRMQSSSNAEKHQCSSMSGGEMAMAGQGDHQMGSISFVKQFWIVVATYVALAVVIAVVVWFYPIPF